MRKSFDTRSGLWLLASIGIAALLTTGAVIAWAPETELTYSQFTLAIGFPMSVILPIIAVLSVTAEWSQRSGLATFTLVPHRGRVLLAKASPPTWSRSSHRRRVRRRRARQPRRTALAGTPTVWDMDAPTSGTSPSATRCCCSSGSPSEPCIRNSPGAIVAYMIYAFVAPGCSPSSPSARPGSATPVPWVDSKYNQDALLQGGAWPVSNGPSWLSPPSSGSSLPTDGRGRQAAPVGGEVTGPRSLDDATGRGWWPRP